MRVVNGAGSTPRTAAPGSISSRASLVAQMLINLSAVQETWFNPWVGKIP